MMNTMKEKSDWQVSLTNYSYWWINEGLSVKFDLKAVNRICRLVSDAGKIQLSSSFLYAFMWNQIAKIPEFFLLTYIPEN